jgi:hypothetical protein
VFHLNPTPKSFCLTHGVFVRHMLLDAEATVPFQTSSMFTVDSGMHSSTPEKDQVQALSSILPE